VVSSDDRMSDVRYVRRVLATLRSCRHRDRRGIVGSFPDYAPQALVHTELDACLNEFLRLTLQRLERGGGCFNAFNYK
jgi:hypothetical protein